MPVPLLAHDVFPGIWPGLLLALLVVAAAVGPRFGRVGGLGVVLVSFLWLLWNGQLEGGILLTLVQGHGLTAADLAGLAGLVVGGRLLLRGRL
jgi:hypothetical protein